MLTSVIIVTHDSLAFIDDCLAQLQQGEREVEIIVVDNGSTDGTPENVRAKHPDIRVIQLPNVGFGAGCNRGVQESNGDVVVFLNPDTVPAFDWLARLVDGLVLGRIHTSQIIHLEEPDRLQALGLDLHYTGVATLRREGEHAPIEGPPEEVPGFSGAAFAMMRSDFEALDGFDEGFFLYMEDVDLAWRARRQGFGIWGIPASRVWHRQAGRLSSSKLAQLRAGRARLVRKHLPERVRLLLSPALGLISFLEICAQLKFGNARANIEKSVVATPLARRPSWLRLTIPFSIGMGPLVGGLLEIIVNPLLAMNGILWSRGRNKALPP